MLLNAKSTTTTTLATEPNDSMSYLVIYNCHNGEVVKLVKPIRYHSLNDFKQFILESFTNYLVDSTDNLFLLTSFGIRLNFNIINEINEVYVFDKRLFNNNESLIMDYFNQNSQDSSLILDNFKLVLRRDHILPVVPNDNIKAMTANLKAFQSWSLDAVTGITNAHDLIMGKYLKHINNIFKGLNTIFQFINNFINEAQKNFNSYYSYVKLLNIKSLHKTWEENFNNLKKFKPIRFGKGKATYNLSALLDPNELTKKSKYVSENFPVILERFNLMVKDLNTVDNEKLQIDKAIEAKRNESILLFKDSSSDLIINKANKLMDKISRSLNILSNESVALVYEENRTNYRDLLELGNKSLHDYQTTLKFKLELLKSNFEVFNTISQLQMKIVNLKNDLKILSQPSKSTEPLSNYTINKIKQSEDYLALTIDLPLLFGFITIEKRRQFEWYDFYSKGVISNVTEQLMTIMDHEKIFQKLWLKKFGSLLNILNQLDIPSKPSLPNLDITLIHNQHEPQVFKILNGIEIEREDISSYIQLVEEYEASMESKETRFAILLNKTFKDLVQSTNNMKLVIKVVNSISDFTSPNGDLSASKFKKLIENDESYNDNIVTGLKTRVKKLEDLLHQQQIKNVSNWPVTRGYSSPKATPPPVSTTPIQVTASTNQTKSLALLNSPVSNTPSPSSTNPTTLLKKHTGPPPLTASTTIDKHLDNIRLRKENKELVEDNDRMRQERYEKDMHIERLMKEIENLKTEKETLKMENTSLKDEITLMKDTYKMSIENKDQEIENYKEQNDNNVSTLKEFRLLNETKDLKIKSFETEINDLVHIKENLLSNITSKELETKNLKTNYEGEIKELHTKIDSLTEDYENLMELTQQQNQSELIQELTFVIESLLGNLRKSVNLIYDNFIELALILESTGLLLVKEFNGETNKYDFKITRVKGLRSKKSDDANNTDFSIMSIENKQPLSKVLEDIRESMEWVDQIKYPAILEEDDIQSLPTNKEDDLDDLDDIVNKAHGTIKLYDDLFKEDTSKFNNFLKLLSFKDESNEMFFLNAISRRFRDVEGFAKKLTKDNKVNVQELSKLSKSASNKISMNNFRINDLVLFLPTRIDNSTDVKLLPQPWAAFNIGAPHYFLNNLNDDSGINLRNKEWLVAKIIGLTEFKITEANVNDDEINPFNLSIGITWYLVDAKEEIINP